MVDCCDSRVARRPGHCLVACIFRKNGSNQGGSLSHFEGKGRAVESDTGHRIRIDHRHGGAGGSVAASDSDGRGTGGQSRDVTGIDGGNRRIAGFPFQNLIAVIRENLQFQGTALSDIEAHSLRSESQRSRRNKRFDDSHLAGLGEASVIGCCGDLSLAHGIGGHASILCD